MPWSIELINQLIDKWDWDGLEENEDIYKKIFKPLINDEFIEEVMKELQKK